MSIAYFALCARPLLFVETSDRRGSVNKNVIGLEIWLSLSITSTPWSTVELHGFRCFFFFKLASIEKVEVNMRSIVCGRLTENDASVLNVLKTLYEIGKTSEGPLRAVYPCWNRAALSKEKRSSNISGVFRFNKQDQFR